MFVQEGKVCSKQRLCGRECELCIKVVAQVSPPGGKVAYVSKGDKKVVQIHQLAPVGRAVEVQFKYFVSESEFEDVQKMFFVGAPALVPVEREEKNELYGL